MDLVSRLLLLKDTTLAYYPTGPIKKWKQYQYLTLMFFDIRWQNLKPKFGRSKSNEIKE
jgi:hypothetical protein